MTDANAIVVRDFLEALAANDTSRALSLLDPDVEWRNSRSPTIRGRRVARAISSMAKLKIGFAVDFHQLSGDGDTVSTVRTDYLWIGPVGQRFRVDGDFTLRDGRILVWDDRFSWRELLGSTRVGKGARPA